MKGTGQVFTVAVAVALAAVIEGSAQAQLWKVEEVGVNGACPGERSAASSAATQPIAAAPSPSARV